ncbi:MAG: hypothetical protein EP329_21130 [Deltaproteobacteria bacterium]|nr:MAG: hypothetical protein EP329_21130 [Deltaproteobacteria bacterium]
MFPDALLALDDYDLRSIHHWGWRDMARMAAVLPGESPLYALLHRLKGERVARRKEVVETLFVLDRIAPELARARTLCEVGAGHGQLGLLAAALARGGLAVTQLDRRQPDSFARIQELLTLERPSAKTAVRYHEKRVDRLDALPACDLAVGVHLCGALTDTFADLACAAGVPFAVVPCCESRALLPAGVDLPSGDPEPLVTAARLDRWRARGYAIEERIIPAEVTDRGRLFVCTPDPA